MVTSGVPVEFGPILSRADLDSFGGQYLFCSVLGGVRKDHAEKVPEKYQQRLTKLNTEEQKDLWALDGKRVWEDILAQ